MTRKSERELERVLDDLGPTRGNASISDYLWANLKDYHEGEEALNAAEKALLENPERHLSEDALQKLDLPTE